MLNKGWKQFAVVALLVLAGFVLPVAGHAGALEDALDNPVGPDGVTSLVFSTDGASPWSADAATSYTGGATARSGAIGATAFSSLTATVSGPATLSFYQKVSSEPAYDALTFYIDNLITPKYKTSGEVNWQQKKFTLPAGSHTLRWKYAKNATISKGSDTAWLDKVVVSPYTTLAVTSPNGGESLAAGGTATITWNAPAAAEKYDLYYTTNNGTSWKLITSGYTSPDFPNVAYSSWAVPVPNGNVSACKIKVVARNAAGSVVATDVSDKPFTVQVLKVTSPNGGETLSAKATPTIAFTISGQQNVASATLSYTLNNGISWSAITTMKGFFPPGSYSYIYSSWNVPAVTTLKSACKVKVVLKSATGAILGTDLSDLTFAIAPVFTLSGAVTLNGHALAGVTMNLSGAGTGSTTTDAYGKYAFTKLLKGNYTITPALSGYNFTPASVNRTISGLNLAGVNFPAQILPTGWSSQTIIGELRQDIGYYNLFSVNVKLNDSDVGVAVWEENSSEHSSVWANRFNGGSWGSPVRVSVGLSGSSGPEVALAANGNATAVWTEKVYDIGIVSNTVWASRYTAASGTWSAPIRISAAPTADYEFYAFSPAVALDSLGHSVVVWVQDDPATPNRSIWTSRDDGNNGWGVPELLSSGTRHCEEDFLAIDGQDNVFVVWRQDTNAYDSGQPGCYNAMTNIWAVIYSSASHSWGEPGLIGDPTLGLCDGTERPRIAVNAGGTAVVVWEQGKGTVSSIGSNRFDPETLAWLAPVTVGSGNPSNPEVSWPAVALDDGGNAFAAWTDYGGDGPEDGWVSRYDASGGGWSAPVLFETDADDVAEVAIDVDGNGNAYLAWVAAGIKARRYTLSGWSDATAIGWGNRLTLDVNSGGSALAGASKTLTQLDYPPGFYTAPYATHYHP